MDTISVNDMIYDRSLNPRLHGVDSEVVELYASIFRDVNWPPILVDRATNKLLDGWHRVEAAKRAGVYNLPVQFADAPEEELFALAVKSNLVHGVKLSREERYKAIVRLQRESWTPERIATFFACSLRMVTNTEKAEDLRIKFKMRDNPGEKLPTESLVEIVRLPPEFHDEVAELASEVEATPADVRRTVRAVKKKEIEEPEQIRRVLCDKEYLKARKAGAPTLEDGHWLMTFATLADQLENSQISITPMERDAAVTLFRRMRQWADRQLSRLGEEKTPSMM